MSESSHSAEDGESWVGNSCVLLSLELDQQVSQSDSSSGASYTSRAVHNSVFGLQNIHHKQFKKPFERGKRGLSRRSEVRPAYVLHQLYLTHSSFEFQVEFSHDEMLVQVLFCNEFNSHGAHDLLPFVWPILVKFLGRPSAPAIGHWLCKSCHYED